MSASFKGETCNPRQNKIMVDLELPLQGWLNHIKEYR